MVSHKALSVLWGAKSRWTLVEARFVIWWCRLEMGTGKLALRGPRMAVVAWILMQGLAWGALGAYKGNENGSLISRMDGEQEGSLCAWSGSSWGGFWGLEIIVEGCLNVKYVL